MCDKIKILEHKLADIEHLEVGLLQVLSEQTVQKPEDTAPPINKPASDMKQRLLKRIAALKAANKH